MYVFVKALSLTWTNSSLASINYLCGQLISHGVRVLHTDTMVFDVLVTRSLIRRRCRRSSIAGVHGGRGKNLLCAGF